MSKIIFGEKTVSSVRPEVIDDHTHFPRLRVDHYSIHNPVTRSVTAEKIQLSRMDERVDALQG